MFLVDLTLENDFKKTEHYSFDICSKKNGVDFSAIKTCYTEEVTTAIFINANLQIFFKEQNYFFEALSNTQHDELESNLKKSSTPTEYGVWKLLSCSFTIQSQKN